MKNKILIGVAIALVIIIAIVLGIKVSGKNTKEIKGTNAGESKEVFVLGLDDSFPPMGFRNEDNEIVGFDIDLAKEVCKKLDMELKAQPISWAAKEQEIDSGNIDCIWNGFSYTEEREKALTLSDVYIEDQSLFFVKKDSNLKSDEDIKGKKIGVQTGSLQEEELEGSKVKENAGEIVGYADNLTALMDLEAGNIDAVYMDNIAGNYIMTTKNKDFTTFESEELSDKVGMVIGFKKGNNELKEKVENALSELKAEGKVQEISEKWFGKDITVIK